MEPALKCDGLELTAVLYAMAHGLFVVDHQRQVRRWNPAMERLTGYSAGEAVGQPCGVFTWLEKDTDDEEDGMCCRLVAAGSMDRFEPTTGCKDGSTLPVLVSARTLKEAQGTPIGAVVTVTDMSTIRRLEIEVTQLRQVVEERYQFHNIVGRVRRCSRCSA